MIIRNMLEKDLPGLSKLYEQFWGETSDLKKMQARFLKLMNDSAYILLCAVENDELLGSVMGIVCDELYGECQPFLVAENMIVDRKCRRTGAGRALFAELEKQAKEKGCAQVILVTETNRHDACRFYESMGFDPVRNKGYKKKL